MELKQDHLLGAGCEEMVKMAKENGLYMMLFVICLGGPLFYHKGPLSSFCLALETVKILEVGKSQKTFLINYGVHDGLALGDVAKFYVPSYPQTYLATQYVGTAVLKKVFGTTSLWSIVEIGQKQLLEPSKKMVLFHVDDFKGTKEKLEIKRRLVVLSSQIPHQVGEVKDQQGRDQPLALTKNQEEYLRGKTVQTVSPRGGDGSRRAQIVDLGEWATRRNEKYYARNKQSQNGKKRKGDQLNRRLKTLYVSELKRGPTEEEVANQVLEKDLESQILTHFQNASHEQRDKENFYKDQKKNELMDEFRDEGVQRSVYNEEMEKRDIRYNDYVLTKYYIKRQGPSWSDDMSDDQLSRFVKNKGINLEEERQYQAKARLFYQEFQSLYSFPITDHSSSTGAGNTNRVFSLILGYEFYGVKIHNLFQRWTARGSMRWSEDVYSLNNSNTPSKEFSVALGINYYIFELPIKMASPLWYVGGGFRRGQSELLLSFSQMSYRRTYLMSSLIGLWTGLKYRWAQNWGMYSELSYENLNFAVESGQSVATGTPEEFSVNDVKLGLGLNFYF